MCIRDRPQALAALRLTFAVAALVAAGNVVMGLVFSAFYLRRRRVMPLVVAHTVMDAVAFLGYAGLAGHVSWLPVPSG